MSQDNPHSRRRDDIDELGITMASVIDAAPNAMLLVDDQGLIVLANTQAERLFGYAESELLGHGVEMLLPGHLRDAHARYRQDYLSLPDTRAMGAGRDLFGKRRDGTLVPVEIGLNPLKTSKGQLVLASIIDITERKQLEKLSRTLHTDALRQSMIDSMPFSIIALDAKGTILAVNPATEHMLGYNRAQMVEQNIVELIHQPDEIAEYARRLSKELGATIAADHSVITAKAERGLADEYEWTYRRCDGDVLPVHVSVVQLKDDSGEVAGFLSVAYDITERKQSQEYILQMAQHDALTGLPNRTLLLERLDQAIGEAQRREKHVGVLMMDLDYFKRVNDTLGHHIGDLLLQRLGKRMQNSLRDSDTLARLGGDEFVIVVPDLSTREQLDQVAEHLIREVSRPVEVQGHELFITPSLGGSMYPEGGLDANELLKNADTAMYAAKNAGRSTHRWFNREMMEQNREKLVLTSALATALDNEQFSIAYQPEIDTVTGQIIGVEALLRWNHPSQGAISPSRFISLAEEAGMILPIGDWVLRTACRELQQLNAGLVKPLKLAVNVSPRQLQDDHWLERIASALEESGLPPQLLEMEITEGMLVTRPDESSRKLQALQRMGARVVVDDFGTGYSSLSYLTRFPIDKLKIDRSFVRDLLVDAKDAAVIDAIIAMAHSLGIRVIAEGVEAQQQWDYLRERGCEELQGFFFSRGVPLDQLPALIDKFASERTLK